MSAGTQEFGAHRHTTPADGVLWTHALAGPLVVSAELCILYALGVSACANGDVWALHVAAAVAVACSIWGALGCARAERRLDLGMVTQSHEAEEPPDESHRTLTSAHFVARVGLMANGLFALFGLLMWIAVAMLPPCPSPA